MLGVGDRRLEQLAPRLRRAARGVKARIARASSTSLPRMWSHDQPRLAGGRAHVLGLGADEHRLAPGRGGGGAAPRPAASARRRGAGRLLFGLLGGLLGLSAACSASRRLAGALGLRALGGRLRPPRPSRRRLPRLGGGLGGGASSAAAAASAAASALLGLLGGRSAIVGARPPRLPRSGVSGRPSFFGRRAHRTLPLRVMAAVGARRRELAELVADHRLGDEHGHVLAAVVDGDRVADHLREDRRRARPGADHRASCSPRSWPRCAP